MTINTRGIVVLVMLQWLPAQVLAALPSIEQLIEFPRVSDIKISPDGTRLAVHQIQDDRYALRIINLDDYSTVGGFSLQGDSEVGAFEWANNERLVFRVLRRLDQAEPLDLGELMAVNADGSDSKLIYGYQASTGAGLARSLGRDGERGRATIINLLPDDKEHIMIAATKFSRDGSKPAIASILNIYTGRRDRGLKTTRYGEGQFFTDKKAEIRFASSIRPDKSKHLEAYVNRDVGWVELPSKDYSDVFAPLSMSDDNNAVLVLDRADADKIGLYKMVIDGSNYERVYAHEEVDLGGALTSLDTGRVYAMRVDAGYPSYLIYSDETQEAGVFKSLLKHFAGKLLYITSHSRDGNLWTIRTRSDTDDGSYFLFNVEQQSVRFLIKARPDIDSAMLAKTTPIEFSSFDGLTVAGYFTPAQGLAGGQVAPLVVLVHGGPRARDYWEFNNEVQVLSTRGYSVLRINFRGSAGYGVSFMHAGNRQWGNAIQKDIIAGTRWAIEEGLAREDAVCIMGGSFGAYSAVQNSILAPELFQCAVANAGVYDLSLLAKTGDSEDYYLGEEVLEEMVGSNTDELAQYSPVNYAQKLNVPLFIAHGKKDLRAPIIHAKRLRKALEMHDKTFTWFIRRAEAHGFYAKENQLEYFNEVLAFLGEHLPSKPLALANTQD